MLIRPTYLALDLLATDLVRSPGLHASQIFGELFEVLDPRRYKYDGPPNPVSLAMGTAWENHLLYLLNRNGIAPPIRTPMKTYGSANVRVAATCS